MSDKSQTRMTSPEPLYFSVRTLLVCILAVILVFNPNRGQAEDSRMALLAESYLIENLIAEAQWDVEIHEEWIEYTCLACGGVVVARLEAISPYHAGSFPTVQERYLAERRQQCSDLVANRLGRCLATQETSVRPSLGGFQSKTEYPERSEIEIVFFYHDRYWPGPELLRTTIEVSEGATLLERSAQMFMWHMARLTVYW